jgi:plastocyanin
MRRALALALAAAIVLVPAAPGAAKHRRHAHAKKHKRHHRDQRVVTPRRRPPVQRPPVERPPVTPPAPKPLSRMQVVAREFSLTLSRQSVTPGPVAIQLANHGQDPHDLRVERADDVLSGFGFTLTKPGEATTEKLDLGPGTWKLFCTLDGHAALGMSATLTVAP